MRTNRMRDRMLHGSAAICGQLVTDSSVIAEVFAHQGFDGVLLDLQHGEIEYTSAVHLLQALSTTDVTPLARIPWNDPAIIMRLLDAGAYGLICPMINTRAECEAFVQAACYPPAGYRSFGPLRAELYGGADYAIHSNDEVLKIAMVETAVAIEHLDAIMSTPGLDGVYVGPSDLSASYSGPFAPDWRSGPVRDALTSVLRTAAHHDIFSGIYVHSPEYGREMIELGFDFVVLQSEVVFIQQQAATALATIHAAPENEAQEPSGGLDQLEVSPA